MAGKTLGQKFYSFKELEDKIKSYQNERYVQLYRRDSRSIKFTNNSWSFCGQ
jgi:hypothetical protein